MGSAAEDLAGQPGPGHPPAAHAAAVDTTAADRGRPPRLGHPPGLPARCDPAPRGTQPPGRRSPIGHKIHRGTRGIAERSRGSTVSPRPPPLRFPAGSAAALLGHRAPCNARFFSPPHAVSPGGLRRCAPRAPGRPTMPASESASRCVVSRRPPPLRSSGAGAPYDARFGVRLTLCRLPAASAAALLGRRGALRCPLRSPPHEGRLWHPRTCPNRSRRAILLSHVSVNHPRATPLQCRGTPVRRKHTGAGSDGRHNGDGGCAPAGSG